jgi:hypothetical protein
VKAAPAPARGPDPHTVIHRRVSRDEEWPRFACGAPAGRSGAGWGAVDCPGCMAVPVELARAPEPVPAAPARPRRTLPT